jgi:hypothetical protein
MKLLQQSPGLAAGVQFPIVANGMRQPHAKPLSKLWVWGLRPQEPHETPRLRTVSSLSAGSVRSLPMQNRNIVPVSSALLTGLQDYTR